MLPQGSAEYFARILSAGNEDAGSRECTAAALDQRLRQRLRDELGGNERRDDAPHSERIAGSGSDGGDGGGRKHARGEPPRDEAIEHDLYGVLAGEHDPTVCG